jgi:heat shock protein HslJ
MPRLLLVVIFAGAALSAQAQTQSPDPALAAGPWRVVEIEGAQAAHGETLRFTGQGIAGQSACNRFSAGLKQQGQAVEISPPVSTRMYCEGRMDDERRYLDALKAAQGYSLSGDTLSLKDADGRTRVKLSK